MLGDETDYVSPPPPVKSARLRVPGVLPAAATQRSESVAAFEPTGQRKLSPRRRLDLAADVKLPRKFFIDLARVKMLVMQPALTLSYTYKVTRPCSFLSQESSRRDVCLLFSQRQRVLKKCGLILREKIEIMFFC